MTFENTRRRSCAGELGATVRSKQLRSGPLLRSKRYPQCAQRRCGVRKRCSQYDLGHCGARRGGSPRACGAAEPLWRSKTLFPVRSQPRWRSTTLLPVRSEPLWRPEEPNRSQAHLEKSKWLSGAEKPFPDVAWAFKVASGLIDRSRRL